MSREEAQDVDTRSDIYSLGVLLYELLVGVVPFDVTALREAGYVEIQRIIRETDPPKQSTRLDRLGSDSSVVAEKRHTDLRVLRRQLHGDLDWITMKALEKDRTRRYETASAFADDVRRHLRDEPIAARRPSAAYRFKKFVRRNRGRMVAGAGAVGFLVVLSVFFVFVYPAIREAYVRRVLINAGASTRASGQYRTAL